MQLRPRPIAAALALCASALFPLWGDAAGLDGKAPEGVVGLKYKEPQETEFLKAVLKAMNLRYTVTPTADGELVE